MNDTPTERADVAVLGAGAAGLSAAWKLVEAGKKVCVVERDGQVGGLSKTVRRGGFSFDLGGHRIITDEPEVLERLQSLMGEELLVRPRRSQIRFRQRYYSYPLEARDLVTKLPPWTSLRCFAGYLWTHATRRLLRPEDDSLEAWIVNRFGRPLYELYFGPYTEKLWGCSPREISSDWAVQRISLLNLGDVILRLLRLRKDTPKTYATRFYYPRRGIGSIWERVADLVRGAGGQVRLNCSVREVRPQEGLVACETPQGRLDVRADIIVSTIPMPALVAGVWPSPDAAAQEAARSLRFRSIRFLNLMLDLPQVSENTWIYASDPELLFFRIQEPRNWSPWSAPEGRTSLILEIACNEGDEVWSADDASIRERCLADLKSIGFDVADAVIGAFSTRAAHAYPVYDLEYARKLRVIRSALEPIDGLICCGRQGLFRYNNMDHSMHMGFLAADAVLGRAPKDAVWRVAAEGEIFERDVA